MLVLQDPVGAIAELGADERELVLVARSLAVLGERLEELNGDVGVVDVHLALQRLQEGGRLANQVVAVHVVRLTEQIALQVQVVSLAQQLQEAQDLVDEAALREGGELSGDAAHTTAHFAFALAQVEDLAVADLRDGQANASAQFEEEALVGATGREQLQKGVLHRLVATVQQTTAHAEALADVLIASGRDQLHEQRREAQLAVDALRLVAVLVVVLYALQDHVESAQRGHHQVRGHVALGQHAQQPGHHRVHVLGEHTGQQVDLALRLELVLEEAAETLHVVNELILGRDAQRDRDRPRQLRGLEQLCVLGQSRVQLVGGARASVVRVGERTQRSAHGQTRLQ
mmetsp:Transcript_6438/g.19502  ORF Transcript_6438/g.19502 Transcript_6438/m.19502 type:complete len:344 (+) Transcript_6438:3789-4820(+)